MADNLPLIPNKYGGCAGDVRPVLRAVFRERAGDTRLPPLQAALPRDCDRDRDAHSADASSRDDVDSLLEHEEKLREQRARRLARALPPHAFTMHAPRDVPPPEDHALLQRADLMPPIAQNAVHRDTLWIRNILNRSSGDGSVFEVTGARLRPAPELPTPITECRSAQSLSIGEVPARVRAPFTAAASVHQRPRTSLLEYLVCIPNTVNFINFTPGKLHTSSLRLVNMSKVEVQVSVRPPRRRELDLQLCGRLKVTAGASTELLVHFKPPNVRSVYDHLLVRVSLGSHITVPISCYIEAPTLDVLMPNMTMSLVSCALDTEGGLSYVGLESAVPESRSAGVRASGASRASAGVEGEMLDLGARLLGEVHHSALVLRCALDHASFFILTEDAWFSHDLSEISESGSLLAGVFALSPAWWRGGGEVRGEVWCRAARAGLQAAALRILATTAITRPLHLVADALYFYPEHVTIKAQEKYYDICSDDDPDCEYYVNLGTTFQHQSLNGSVLILNHSPLTYSYYWSVRAWGECSCWQEEQHGAKLGAEEQEESGCAGVGARVARAEGADEAAAAVQVEPAQGAVSPRATAPVRIIVPDVGGRLGTQRAVLILVLRNIPQKSFPQGFYPMIVSTSTVKTEHVPGFKREERVYCDVVCCQLEVWWHVTPLWFVLDPPLIHLPYSRRVQRVVLQMRATQLFAGGSARANWLASQVGAVLPPAVKLRVAQSQQLPVTLCLTELPNDFPFTETVTLDF